MPEITPQIRWMIRRDLREVMEIEEASFDSPWSEADFMIQLRQRAVIGMVAEYQYQVIGFMLYELHEQQLEVLNFAIDPEFRRQQAGTVMVNRLIDKLSTQRRKEVFLTIRESNLSAQLFFSEMGFRADSVLRGYYDNSDEDAYLFRYLLERPESEFAPGLAPKNRISKYIHGKEVEP